MKPTADELGARLRGAVEAGMQARARELLREGADPNWASLTERGGTPFLKAVQAGMGDLAMEMLPRADVWEGEGGDLPWLLACEAKDARLMRALCEAMASSPRVAERPRWALSRCGGAPGKSVGAAHLAVQAGSEPCLRVALEFGAEISELDERGLSPLLAASEGGDEACVAALLEFGAGSDEDELRAAARLACAGERPKALAALLDKEPRIIQGASSPFGSLAHEAARRGSIACLALLVERGADAGERDGGGGTPLMAAAAEGREEALRLLAPISDAWGRDAAGSTALARAAAAGAWECVELLAELMAADGDRRAEYLAELCCALGEARGSGAGALETANLAARARSATEALSLSLAAGDTSPRSRAPGAKRGAL